MSTSEAVRARHAEATARSESELARRQQERADRAALEAGQNLYAAHMSLARQAWDQNNGRIWIAH